MKKKGKWKVIGYCFLGIIIVAVAAIGFEYHQLQPQNHFKTIPVVATGKAVTPGKPEQPEEQKQTQQQTNANAPGFNILIMGSDERPGETIGHSDTMMLVHVDLGKNLINAVSIPRDTRVHLDGYGYTKLTSVQYILQANKGPKQGIEQAVQAISELTGVPINYYVETNFEGLQSMVDAMGGITMNVPADEKINNQVINAGAHSFDGKMVLALARERHSLANGDYGRQQLQLEALKGIAKKALSPSNIPKLPSLINSVSKYMIGTNMSTSDMLSLGLTVKNFDPNKQLNYLQLQGVGESLYDDILKAKNDQIVIDPQQMKSIIAQYF
ncbi:LCP family protein [Neobacillus ginsengisoli]|uniref:LCP family protein required for cell wall assembly n=1 Tax=Neobacillus ginsengisoli TaxID=904295 RepID=A0ABT9Y241_9BACI|nr:LCP family protein [Neobacillus ginsengisoli]MDQ0201889.1 LCP family protein required for cell wall assembly [Neobacillus ginsengisoli]